MASNQPVAIASATDIRDIAPPIDIPSGLAWLWWGLAALAIAVAALLCWRRWRKRAAQVPVIPVVPAHVRAKQKLQEALALIAQPKPFVIAVSAAVRWYLEERFNFRAPERTTEEFLHELQRTDRLTRDQKESLGEFLASCDLVKFAKYEPGEPELRELHGAALRLIEETEPSNSVATNTSISTAEDNGLNKKPQTEVPIADIMREYAINAVAHAQDQFGIKLDYSEQSLLKVDDILTRLTQGGLIQPDKLEPKEKDELWLLSKLYGGYIGEVVVRHIGATWHSHSGSGGGTVIQLKIRERLTSSPPERVWKRLTNSEYDTIIGYYRGAQHVLGLKPFEPEISPP